MIRAERDGAVLRLVLDRPHRANALTGEMLEALGDALADVQARAVVITGSGGVFSAGADLDEARAGLAVSPLWAAVTGRIAALPCLSVAALNGTCAGGAMGLALACDLRVAVPGARFFYPAMRLGYRPQAPDVRRLEALVGPGRARMLLLGGARIDAAEALAQGLVDRVAEDLDAEVAALCADALGAEPAHAAAIKAMLGPL